MTQKTTSKQTLIVLLVILAITIIFAGIFYYYNSVSISKTGVGIITPQAQEAGPSLALNPSSGSFDVDSIFNVEIRLDSDGQPTFGVDVEMTYDSQYLEIQDASNTSNGIQIQEGTIYPWVNSNIVDPSTGIIDYRASCRPQDGNCLTPSGAIVATINFKVLQPAALTAVNFNFTLGDRNDSNIVQRQPDGSTTDILSNVIHGQYTLVNPIISLNYTANLQGRDILSGDHSATGVTLQIYNPGESIPIFQQSNLNLSSSGDGNLQITDLGTGNYDYRLIVPYFLSRRVNNHPTELNTTVDFGQIKAGNLDNTNEVNMLDFGIMAVYWGQADLVSDLDQSGEVNMLDFGIMAENWGLQGE